MENKKKNIHIEQPVLFSEMNINGCKVKLNFLTKPNENVITGIKKALIDNMPQTVSVAQ